MNGGPGHPFVSTVTDQIPYPTASSLPRLRRGGAA